MKVDSEKAGVDPTVEIAGVRLASRLVLASGIWGTHSELLVRAARSGAGAVTSKSCGLEPRAGHKNPTVLDWGGGLINAVGLTNPGVEAEVEDLARARVDLQSLGVPLIASVFADSVDSFSRVAQRICAAQPDLVELNISCPNVEAEMGRPFAVDCASAAAVTRAARRVVDRPLVVKLSPNVTDIGEVARAVEDAGADALAAINTLGPGMVIDLHSGAPILANRVGGVSGPAIRPIAVRCVYDVCAAVRIPVIGIGGVVTGHDALEMVMAGASAVGLGSALYYRGLEAFADIRREMEALMEQLGFRGLAEIRGIAHARP
jgi:dihydroorotate dehydrogenase (NAD+) catalytic subunit